MTHCKVSAIETHKHCVQTVTSGCEALSVSMAFCLDTSIKTQALGVSVQAAPVVLDMMVMHMTCLKAVISLTKALVSCALVAPSHAFEQQIIKRDAISLLVRCLKLHSDDEKFLTVICKALIIIHYDGARDRCRETGAIEALLGAAVRFKHSSDNLGHIRYTLMMLTQAHAQNTAYLARVMTPKQAKILGTCDTQIDTVEKLQHSRMPGNVQCWTSKELEGIQALAVDNERRIQQDVVAQKLSEREREKLAEACSLCGKTAQELGLVRLLRCSACTIAPLYCSAECQRGAWKMHKSECKASRIAGKK